MASVRLTRRQAVVGAAAMGVGLAVPGRVASRPRRRVVVVGAGMAGLAAATAARAGGFDVVVLEAAARVGGRMHTLRGFAAGQVAEGGGEYIDGGHTVMRAYARRLGLPLDDVSAVGSDNPGCLFLGGRRSADHERHDAAEHRFYSALDVTDGDPSVASVLDRMRLTAGARRHLEHTVVRDDYTVEAADLSAAFAANVPDASGGQPERFRVRGGNDQIPSALAASLGSRVLRGTPVTAITRGAAGVTVTAGGESFRGAACVLAAPLPALRGMTFTPPLPADLARAVTSLQYGTGAKVALQYATRPWIAQGFNGDTRTDLPISTTWEATDAQPGGPGILLVYTVGAPGTAFFALPDDDRIAAAADDVARIYPGAPPIAAQTLAWEHTYAAYAPGTFRAFRRALRRPVGRLLLAGEHASDLTGYMEGAARSGLRAARLVTGRV